MAESTRKKIHQMIACLPVILNELMVGIAYGWLAPIIAKMDNPESAFNFTASQISWLASISEVGKIFGTLVAPLLVDNVGRKYTLVLMSMISLAVWISIIFVRNFYLLSTSRVIIGVSIGINDVVAGIYTTENCSPTFRGIIGGFVQVTFFGGIFLEFVIASYTPFETSAIINTVLASCAFASLYFAIETPYFLIMMEKPERATESLIKLSGNTNEVEISEEFKKIEQNISEEKLKRQSLKLLLLSGNNLKAILLVLSMHILMMATGTAAVDAYASQIFSQSDEFSVRDYTVLYGAAQFIAVVISPFILEKVNRRPMVIGSYLGMTWSNLCAGLLINFHSKGSKIIYYPWLIFGSVTLVGMCITFIASELYVLKGELLPFSVRAIGSSIAVTGFSISSFLVVKLFQPITDQFGIETNFFMYSIVSFVTAAILYRVLPETRGKTLHELQPISSCFPKH